MIILTTATEAQAITFIPRKDVEEATVILTRKDERDAVILPCVLSISGDYTIATSSFNLVEGSRYSLRIVSRTSDFVARVEADGGIVEAAPCAETLAEASIDAEDIIYRDMVLCTDQTEYDKYNVQKEEYIEAETSDNEYIVVNE